MIKNKKILLLLITILTIACSNKKMSAISNKDSINNRAYKLNKDFILKNKIGKNYNIKIYKDFVFITYGNNLIKMNKNNDDVVWKISGNYIDSSLSMSFDDDNIYFVSINNDFYMLKQFNGKIDFIYYCANEITILNRVEPIIYDNKVLVVFNNNKIVLFDKNKKNIILSKNVEKNIIFNSADVSVKNDKIFIKNNEI